MADFKIPESTRKAMWQFMLKRSVPQLLKEKIEERERTISSNEDNDLDDRSGKD